MTGDPSGERVGMRAQSVYSYFASKHETYDTMFLEGHQAFAAWMGAIGVHGQEILDVSNIEPIGHREAMELQATGLDRAIALLRWSDRDWSALCGSGCGNGDWIRTDPLQTVYPDWDVRQMWLHVLGASETGAFVRENVHQMRVARKRQRDLGVSLEAGSSGVQVTEREGLSPAELDASRRHRPRHRSRPRADARARRSHRR